MSASSFSLSGWRARVVNEDLSYLGLIDEESFLRVLDIEQKRTERSGRRFVLLLLPCSSILTAGGARKSLEGVLHHLSSAIRATDITGWYKRNSVIGVIFTEVGSADNATVTEALRAKLTQVLASALGQQQAGQVEMLLHVFPEHWDPEQSHEDDDKGPGSGIRSPDTTIPRKACAGIKRAIDITGSLSALILLSPVMAAIAIAIKLTSPGPVLFKQHRIGHHGRKFSFWKFRSMRTGNNAAIHEEFVKTLIAGQNGASAQDGGQKVYKITHDPRITPIGRFLRRTSLDELPQFFNVLTGHMSLVGPRPPIPYEVKYYDIWHRRRVLDAKPGITGLWQVTGRSRVGFDEMVRLDLRYATSWSLWLDFKILLQTPRAVFGGEGAR